MSTTIRAGDMAVQDPSDIRVYTFDWDAENLPPGVIISGAALWTISTVGPLDATVMTKDQETIVSGSRKAQVRLQGGQHGARYNIACKITTNESPPQTKEQSFDMLVENR
jgi:hypothetical protein